MNFYKLFLCLLFPAMITSTMAQNPRVVWSIEHANNWYQKCGWLRGCDFIPSTAVNQLEMWQATTFDPVTIDRELGFAEGIGMNCMRVFLHHVAWQEDPSGFKNRINTFLGIADKHHIRIIFVFFDDCWNPVYHKGAQPKPKVGVHNSQWIRDPGTLFYTEPLLVDTLKAYVKDILITFRSDKRILLWDLYNEPGNSGYENKSMSLLQKVFNWARSVNPGQPLTAGIWNSGFSKLNAFQLANSDIITYHNYDDSSGHLACIDTLKKYHRPLICTEYMARPRNSTFFSIMPMLKKNDIGAINWGLVAGKTNTIYAWDSPMPDGAEPKIWFHDIFRPDGEAYNENEIQFIKSLTGMTR